MLIKIIMWKNLKDDLIKLRENLKKIIDLNIKFIIIVILYLNRYFNFCGCLFWKFFFKYFYICGCFFNINDYCILNFR